MAKKNIVTVQGIEVRFYYEQDKDFISLNEELILINKFVQIQTYDLIINLKSKWKLKIKY